MDNPELCEEDLDLENQYEETQLVLKKRSDARSRYTFVYEADTIAFATKMKTRKNRHSLFVIPFHIKDTGEPIKAWSDVTTRNQIILDLRTENAKQNVRLNRNVHTFKQADCDVF